MAGFFFLIVIGFWATIAIVIGTVFRSRFRLGGELRSRWPCKLLIITK